MRAQTSLHVQYLHLPENLDFHHKSAWLRVKKTTSQGACGCFFVFFSFFFRHARLALKHICFCVNVSNVREIKSKRHWNKLWNYCPASSPWGPLFPQYKCDENNGKGRTVNKTAGFIYFLHLEGEKKKIQPGLTEGWMNVMSIQASKYCIACKIYSLMLIWVVVQVPVLPVWGFIYLLMFCQG